MTLPSLNAILVIGPSGELSDEVITHVIPEGATPLPARLGHRTDGARSLGTLVGSVKEAVKASFS